MLNIITFTGNVVQLRRDVKGLNENTSFKYNEIDIINEIKINTERTSGIKIYFASGKVLVQKNATNYNSWLKRYFKLTS